MKRIILAALLIIGLVAGIVVKIRAQSAALQGPPRGSGVIEGTDLDIAAQISARIEGVVVKKGQRVENNQLLAVLDCADVNAAIAEAQARVAAAEAQHAAARANVSAARRATSVALVQAEAAKARGDALEQRSGIAQRNLDRLINAGDSVSIASVDQNQAEASSLVLEQRAAVETARATAAQAGVAAAQGDAARSSELAAAAAIESAKANLQRALLLRRECELHAPRSGYVEEVYLEPGEVAPRGGALLRLVDIEEVKIIFYLPNEEIGRVRLGQSASVSADAYGSTRFTGAVTSISMEAAFTPRNIQTRTDRDRLVFPIEVTIKNVDHRLRPGMPADVTLVVGDTH